MFIPFNTIHERDRQADTTRRHRLRLCKASCGKNATKSWKQVAIASSLAVSERNRY